jgi:hypothetical protein
MAAGFVSQRELANELNWRKAGAFLANCCRRLRMTLNRSTPTVESLSSAARQPFGQPVAIGDMDCEGLL